MPPGDASNELEARLREAPSNFVPGQPADLETFAAGERIQVRNLGADRAGLRVNGETVVKPGDTLAFDEERSTKFIPKRFTAEPGELTVEVFNRAGDTRTLQADVLSRSELSEREQALNDPGQQNISSGGQAAAATDDDVVAATTEELQASRGISAEALAPGDEPSTIVGPDALGNPSADAAVLGDRERVKVKDATAAAGDEPFDERPDVAGTQVGGVDGRKARVEGPGAASNPTDETRAVVLDRAGDEGRRAFPLSDDPVAPDTPEAAREIGEPGTSDVAINRRGEAQRVGALPTVFPDDEEPPSLDVNPRGSVDTTGFGAPQSPVSAPPEFEAAGEQQSERTAVTFAVEDERDSVTDFGADASDGPIESVVANAEARTEARREGVLETENDLGDTPVVVPGTDGDVRVESLLNEATSGTQEFVDTGATFAGPFATAALETQSRAQRTQEIIELGTGQGGFEATRRVGELAASDDVDEFRESIQEGGGENERTVENALSGAAALPNLPLDVATTAKEAGETGVFLTEGTALAGGTQEEFDRRAGEVADATAARGESIVDAAEANPAQVGGSFVFGSAAEVAAVGGLGGGVRAGRVNSAGRAVDTFTPDSDSASTTQLSEFVADERGMTQLSEFDGAGRSETGSVSTESLPDDIAGTAPVNKRSTLRRQRPGERSRLSSGEQRIRDQARARKRERARARQRVPDDDLRSVLDVEQTLRDAADAGGRPATTPTVGPAVGGLLGADSAAEAGEPALASGVEQEVEANAAAAQERAEAEQETIADALDRATETELPTDLTETTRPRTETRTDQRFDTGLRLDTRVDTDQRVDTGTDTRLDTGLDIDSLTRQRSDTETRTEFDVPPRRVPRETDLDGGERDSDERDEPGVDFGSVFRNPFSNPVTSPTEFLGGEQ